MIKAPTYICVMDTRNPKMIVAWAVRIKTTAKRMSSYSKKSSHRYYLDVYFRNTFENLRRIPNSVEFKLYNILYSVLIVI